MQTWSMYEAFQPGIPSLVSEHLMSNSLCCSSCLSVGPFVSNITQKGNRLQRKLMKGSRVVKGTSD